MNRYRVVIILGLILNVGTMLLPANASIPVFNVVDDSLSHQRAFDYYYLQALVLKEQGEHDSALEMLEHCFFINPKSPAVLFELSNYYMYLAKKNEALEFMKRAVKEEPGNFWYRQILATAYENNDLINEAVNVYEKMAIDFPANSEIYLILAGIYTEESMFEKAIEALNNYERKEGKSEQISMQKYNTYMLMQDSTKAIEEVNKLASEYPEDLRYKVLLGDVYLQNDNFLRAYELYREVLNYESDNVNAQLALVNYYKLAGENERFKVVVDTLLMNNKLSSAIRSELLVKVISELEKSGGDSIYITNLCERLIALPGNQLPTISVYVQYLIMKNAGEDLISPLLHRIIKIEPENKMAQLQLLNYAIQRKDYSDIISRADTAILYNPEILQLYYYRGIACYQQKMPEEALRTFKRGLQMRSEDTEVDLISELFTLVGDTEHELGNQTATLEAYDSALIYNPHNIIVLNNYAYYLALEGRDLERAADMSFKTIKEEPENPIYIDTYMWILFLQKRYEEAKVFAEKLIKTNENMSAVEYSHCGDIFYMNGDIERAVDCWLEAQKMGDDSKILKRKIKKKKYISDGTNKK